MHPLDINVSERTVSPCHLKAGVSEYFLQAKDIATVSKKVNGGGVTERMRRTPDSHQPGFAAVFRHFFLYRCLGHHPPRLCEEDKVVVNSGGIGTAAVDVMPQGALHLLPDRDQTLLVPLATHLYEAIFHVQIFHLQTAQLRYPETGIKQRQENDKVTIAGGGFGVDGMEQLLDLRSREGRYHFYRRPWNLHLVEGVALHDLLGNEPVVEDPEAPEIAVDGMPRKASLLGMGQGVGGKASCLLQVEDVCPDLAVRDIG